MLYFISPKSHKQTLYIDIQTPYSVKNKFKPKLTKIPINNPQPRTNTTPTTQKSIQRKQINPQKLTKESTKTK